MSRNNSNRNTQKRAMFVAAGLAGLAATASAQGLMITDGEIISYVGQQAPGLAPGILIGGSGTFSLAGIDDAGNALFRARFVDTIGGQGVSAINERAYFSGSTGAGLTLVLRSGDAAPGLPGVTMSTATGNGPGGTPRVSPDGRIFFGTNLTGAGVTTANDTAYFAGPMNAPVFLVREGDAAPSGGSTMTGTFSNPSTQPTGYNRNGYYLFQTSLAGGDVVGTTNNAAWIVGSPLHAMQFAIRKGDLLPGGEIISALGFISQLNEQNQLLTEVSLLLGSGSTPVDATNNQALLMHSPGSGFVVVAREGQAAPGTVGATFNVASNSWFFNCPANGFTSDGKAMILVDLLNGDTIASTNDRAIYFVSATNPAQLALRRGDAAPGTDGTFDTRNLANSAKGDGDRFAIQSSIIGGTTTPADNSGLWAGTPGNLQLVVREGTQLPGAPVGVLMVGSSATSPNPGFGSRFMTMNANGQVIFETELLGPGLTAGVNDQAWCVWDPILGLRVLARRGEQLEISPGVFKTISSMGTVQFNNGDGSPIGFNENGVLVHSVNFDDGTSSIVTTRIPSNPGVGFCFGDGTATACPCGNSGGVGRGCANSIDPNGAFLTASGFASLSNDSLTLLGSGMPNSSALYFQGTSQQAGGLGAIFGDGLRCAGGTVVRLKTVFNVSNASQYPEVGDPSVSVQGGILAPGTRTYQAWYRNAAIFCILDATFNLSNGLSVNWTL